MNILEFVALEMEAELRMPRKRVLGGPTENGEECTYRGRLKRGSQGPIIPANNFSPTTKSREVDAISSAFPPPRLECDSHYFTVKEVQVHASWRQLDLRGPEEEWRSITCRVQLLFSHLQKIIEFGGGGGGDGQQGT